MANSFLSKRHKKAFSLRVTLSENFSDISPFVGLMKEFAGYAIEYGSEVIPIVDEMQQLLYDKGILPFMVKCTDDYYKINKLPPGCVHDFLWYVHLSYKRVEEDWYWDEKLQQYVARNDFWAEADKRHK